MLNCAALINAAPVYISSGVSVLRSPPEMVTGPPLKLTSRPSSWSSYCDRSVMVLGGCQTT